MTRTAQTHPAFNRPGVSRHALHRYLLTAAGVLLSTMTLTALAAPSERALLAECKDLAQDRYGEETRVRLYNIRNRAGMTELRLRVNPAEAAGANLLCTAAADEEAVLRTRDGVALEPAASAPVALAGR
ncbi:MAG: hypothetical protein ACX93N_14370 [Pseudohaliea sp.]